MQNNYYNAYPNGGYATAAQAQDAFSLQSYIAKVMRRVFGKMFLGLLITALTSFLVAASPAMIQAIFGNRILFFGLIIAEFALVWGISGAINKLSNTAATLLFYLYSLVNGATLSVIFLAYELGTIGLAFATTSLTFGAMSLYGYITKQDLSKLGSLLMMALFGVIIASVVNFFLASSMFNFIISIVAVIIFTGLTAWDTQKIKQMAAMTDVSQAGKVATLGALSLYLDFVNLFLYILRLLGGNRD